MEKYLKKNGIAIVCDIKDSILLKKCIEDINKNFNSIDILINNAGITQNKLIFNTSLSEWSSILSTNLTSAFILSKSVLPNMIKKKMVELLQ